MDVKVHVQTLTVNSETGETTGREVRSEYNCTVSIEDSSKFNALDLARHAVQDWEHLIAQLNIRDSAHFRLGFLPALTGHGVSSEVFFHDLQPTSGWLLSHHRFSFQRAAVYSPFVLIAFAIFPIGGANGF